MRDRIMTDFLKTLAAVATIRARADRVTAALREA